MAEEFGGMDNRTVPYNTSVNMTTECAATERAPLAQTDIEFIFTGVVIPSIGLFGVFGNLLNLIILSWRYNKREVDVLEKGALLGLIALAVSDMLFCLLILPHVFFYKHKTLFFTRSFRMYYQLYGLYFKNVFIKTSTFLTLVVGLARYIGICHPLRARLFIGLHGMRAACVVTYVLWLALMSPMLWMYTVHEHQKANTSLYILDLGAFSSHAQLSLSFTYLWAFLGYFIPVAVLAFCNINLIRALRQSMRLREATVRSSQSGRDVSTRITLTLVVLIVMFMLLVSPSEVLHFVDAAGITNRQHYRHFEVAIVITNVMQAANVAFHFVLYCVVNVTFRRTIFSIVCCIINSFRKVKTTTNGDGKYHHSLLPMAKVPEGQSSFKSSCRTSITRVTDNETYL